MFINHILAKFCRVLANGPGDLGSISGRVIRENLKTVLDTSLLNTQQYKLVLNRIISTFVLNRIISVLVLNGRPSVSLARFNLRSRHTKDFKNGT